MVNKEEEYKPNKLYETKNFTIKYNEVDEKIIDKIANVLEDNYI